MTPSSPPGRLWWRDGVIYQIYPRSFMDASGDGVGDLEGIRQKLDHLSWLGIDGIWISPCFPSPGADFGYDVSDYCDIDPLFGSLADFDRLLADAHARGIRVLLDWVPNHTSDRHPWFLESRSSRESPRRHWYVWRDPKPGGSLPNNWRSAFGGPAWEWDEATGQYYLHSFLKEQPELDWRNPEVEAAMHEVLRFWLDRGVDGFRIDVVHRLAKDPQLRDNPPSDPSLLSRTREPRNHHNHPDVHRFLRGIRKVLDGYLERAAVGEVYLMDPAEVVKFYGRGDELHLAFNFSFLHSPWSAEAFRGEVERLESLIPAQGWPTLVLSSHDVHRHASRYDHPELGDARARVAAMMLLTLRGTPFMYYTEEIGMRNVKVPPERLQDPLGKTHSERISRDPERTPMQWEPTPGAGFTTADPWLPIGDPGRCNVRDQRADGRSLLWLYRDLIELRRRTPALERGAYRTIEAPEGVFAYERAHDGSRARIALNFADQKRVVDLGPEPVREALVTRAARMSSGGRLELEPAEGVVVVLMS